jgi:hypothetical protein
MDYQSQLAADDADGEDEGQLDAEEEPDAEEDDTTEDRAAEVHATATHETMDEDDRAGEEDTTATQETPDEEAVSSAPPPSVVCAFPPHLTSPGALPVPPSDREGHPTRSHGDCCCVGWLRWLRRTS